MDVHAENISVAFVKWIADKDGADKLTLIDHNWYYDNDKDGDMPITEKKLYDQFIKELLCKNVNQAASASLTKKQENQ